MWKFFISIIDDARLLSFLCILWHHAFDVEKDTESSQLRCALGAILWQIFSSMAHNQKGLRTN